MSSSPAARLRDSARSFRAGPLIIGALLAGGCANQTYHALPVSADGAAAGFDARSFHDAGLREFLAANLARDFTTPPTTWDFETLAWVAFYFHPALDVARAQWAIARATQVTATARANPTLTVTPGYDTNAPAGVSPWLPALAADFTLDSGRRRNLRSTAAEHEGEAAHQAVFTAAWAVRGELRQAFIALGFAEQRTATLRAQTELQHAALALLAARFEAGAIDSSTVSMARLALVRAETMAAAADSELPGARQRVATALGLPGSAIADASFDHPPQSTASWSTDALTTARREALQSRPDVLAALSHYAATEATLELEVTHQRPAFHLGPGYQWDQGENKWTLGLTLELPLFNHNEGPIAEAVARRSEAAASFLATQARVIGEIDGAAAAQTGATIQLTHLHRAHEELNHTVARTQARFDAGAADQLDVQNARLELAAATTAELDAEEQAMLADGRLEDALQIPFANLPALGSPPRDISTASSP